MTKQTHSSSRILNVANLVAVGSSLLAIPAAHAQPVRRQAVHGNNAHPQTVEKLNVASLKSIESTWLSVPNSCKARGFNADPVSLQVTALKPKLQQIYASFGA